MEFLALEKASRRTFSVPHDGVPEKVSALSLSMIPYPPASCILTPIWGQLTFTEKPLLTQI